MEAARATVRAQSLGEAGSCKVLAPEKRAEGFAGRDVAPEAAVGVLGAWGGGGLLLSFVLSHRAGRLGCSCGGCGGASALG